MTEYIKPGFIPDLPPFKSWLATNVPAVYDNTMSYYDELTALIKYIEDSVIPAVNTNASAIGELQTDLSSTKTDLYAKYNELKDYVDHYFDNLDIQTEINNKLDQMVTDGTLGNIIEPYLTAFEAEIRDQVNTIGDVNNLQTVLKNNVVNGVNCANENYSGLWRTQYGNGYVPVDLSEGVSFFSDNVTIYQDRFNNSYAYYCDIDKHKNSGGTTIYVDPATDVPVGEQDGTEAKPYNKISTAYSHASDNDTIALADGFYNRNETGNFYIKKSINLVAKSGQKNKVFCSAADDLTWTPNPTYTNVYETTRSNVSRVIDIRNHAVDKFAELTQVNDLATCATTPYSYAKSGSTVYVNIGEAVTDDKILLPLEVSACFRVTNDASDLNVYMENITFLGGAAGLVSVTESGGYYCKFVAKGCNFYYSKSDNDALPIQGADSILLDCKACYGGKDGFNYHNVGTHHCNSIELECLASNNGLNRHTGTENGSTTHAGNKALRINCVYFNNYGANVCDVGTDTVSVNIQCTSFDSASYGGNTKSDFNAQQSGTLMKLYNCHTRGSKSAYNIYAVENATVDVYNCNYDTTGGDGTITIH